MPVTVSSIYTNYHRILGQIAKTATASGRDPADVKLVVVTKGHPAAVVEQAIEAGAERLGENYPEEGAAKKLAVSSLGDKVEWHMIGHVQSRKAHLVCETYTCIHSLDSLKLARRLDGFALGLGIRLPVLLECNTSGESSKFGFPIWDENTWPGMLETFTAIASLPNLEVQGLMTMAPFFNLPEPARPYFRRLRTLQQWLYERLPEVDWHELSMGMSGDFQPAVEEGATLVRIGTAILGVRTDL